MSETQIIALPDRESPRGRVAAEVRGELAKARISGSRLAELLGQSQPYWSRRLTAKVAFDIDDLAAIARLLNVDMSVFVPAGSGWAPRGSNSQPADQTSVQVSDVSNLILGGFPWHEDPAEDYADAPDAEVIHLGTIAGPERSAR